MNLEGESNESESSEILDENPYHPPPIVERSRSIYSSYIRLPRLLMVAFNATCAFLVAIDISRVPKIPAAKITRNRFASYKVLRYFSYRNFRLKDFWHT